MDFVGLITTVNNAVNGIVWGLPAIVCILGVGIYLTLRTGVVQVTRFGHAMREIVGKIFHRGEAADGMITPFQAICTALAGTVGTGNIAGVAGAIAIGGPGAVFWMWMSALLGMCTKFAEVTLAVHFRETNSNGEVVGGPMYYIKNGLPKHWHWLAGLFAFFGVCAVFGTGNATQANTIVSAINTALISYNVITPEGTAISNLVIGCIISLLVALILFGGVKRIGRVTEKLVPFMVVLYFVLGIGVIILNVDRLPSVFYAIFYGAFNPAAVTGGIVGSAFLCLQKGVARGIFSNEAGLGTGSIAHACSDTQDAVHQGLFGIFEVFTDTIIVCSITALTILCSGTEIVYGQAAGADLTISGFTTVYGNWVSILMAVSMCCFAFSTIISWGLYGSRCLEYLTKGKFLKVFLLLYVLVSIPGATVDLGLLWSIAETFNGLMAIPNLIALFLLSGTVVKLAKEYFATHK